MARGIAALLAPPRVVGSRLMIITFSQSAKRRTTTTTMRVMLFRPGLFRLFYSFVRGPIEERLDVSLRSCCEMELLLVG